MRERGSSPRLKPGASAAKNLVNRLFQVGLWIRQATQNYVDL